MKALALAALLCAAPATACNLPASRLLSLQNPPLYADTVLASAGLPHRYTATERPRRGGSASPAPHTPIVPLPPSLGLLLGALAFLGAFAIRRAG